MPGVEDTETDFTIIVQVWIEAHTVVTSGFHVDEWWGIWVVRREENIKLKTSILIGCVRWSSDKYLIKTPQKDVRGVFFKILRISKQDKFQNLCEYSEN